MSAQWNRVILGAMSRNDPPDPIDLFVGAQIKMRRTALGLNQSELGRAVGVTFQQIQKYERGSNRVSASMLYRITRHLGCQVGDVFPEAGETQDGSALNPATRQTIRALTALSGEHRHLVLSVARALGSAKSSRPDAGDA